MRGLTKLAAVLAAFATVFALAPAAGAQEAVTPMLTCYCPPPTQPPTTPKAPSRKPPITKPKGAANTGGGGTA